MNGGGNCGCICGGWNGNGITDYGVEAFSDQPLMASETTRGIHLDHDTVPPFLIKLYEIVDDKATASIISWGSSCTSFIIFDERQFISQIIPSYFKTSHFDSFTSQLRIYGFKKNDRNHLEFEHEHFQQGKRHLLKHIKRRGQHSKAINTTPMPCITTNTLQDLLTQARLKQNQINKKMQTLKDTFGITSSEIQTIINDTIHKLTFNFSQGIGQKRKFVEIDSNINFVNIKKEFESIYEQNEASGDGADIFGTLRELVEEVADKHDSRGKGVNVVNHRDGCRAPSFLQKLYDMVEKKELDSYISWTNLPSRDRFVIWDINNFATHVLPIYFKHSNFSSFNSQLNIYCFKKVSWERHEYANEWFQGGRRDLLANIKRREKYRPPTTTTSATMYSCSSTEETMFQNRLKPILQDKDNKLTWLSKYEEKTKSSMHELKETVVNLADIVNKMIGIKSNEKVENNKKGRVEIRDNVIDDVTGNKTPRVEGGTYLDDEQEIDVEALAKIMDTEDSRIIERELDYYFSLWQGNTSEKSLDFSDF